MVSIEITLAISSASTLDSLSAQFIAGCKIPPSIKSVLEPMRSTRAAACDVWSIVLGGKESKEDDLFQITWTKEHLRDDIDISLLHTYQ